MRIRLTYDIRLKEKIASNDLRKQIETEAIADAVRRNTDMDGLAILSGKSMTNGSWVENLEWDQ